MNKSRETRCLFLFLCCFSKSFLGQFGSLASWPLFTKKSPWVRLSGKFLVNRFQGTTKEELPRNSLVTFCLADLLQSSRESNKNKSCVANKKHHFLYVLRVCCIFVGILKIALYQHGSLHFEKLPTIPASCLLF